MTDIDRVFARFRDSTPSAEPQREVLNIRRRGGGQGTRAVEVVHVRSERSPVRDQPERPATVRAAAWSEGFPVKPALVAPVEAPAPKAVAEPKRHIMPAWQPSESEPASKSVSEPDDRIDQARRRRRQSPVPSSADPFDDQDDGANCLRCGHRIQEGRERRGLMTCAGCG